MSIRLCVFDMAGTTVDEHNIVYQTLCEAIHEIGYLDITLDQVLAIAAGKEKYRAICDILQAHTSEANLQKESDNAFTIFKEKLSEAYHANTITTFPGMKEFFQRLRERHIAVILNTGYASTVANKILSILDWQIGRDIDGLVTADDVAQGRPAPDMIIAAMAIAGVSDAKEVLKAGDSAVDIEEGHNAGCSVTVGVLSGAQTVEQLKQANPTVILNYLTELDVETLI